MVSIANRAFGSTSPWALSMAFVERQTNLWKRYWGWELVWLVYGVVNTVAITLIADQAGAVSGQDVSKFVLFLLIGTLVWAYLSAVLDDISLVIQWERWEGTIEHTLMAPVPRSLHLLGMSVFGILHGLIRTLLIFAIALLFFDIDFGNVDVLATVAVVLVGSVSVAALAQQRSVTIRLVFMVLLQKFTRSPMAPGEVRFALSSGLKIDHDGGRINEAILDRAKNGGRYPVDLVEHQRASVVAEDRDRVHVRPG